MGILEPFSLLQFNKEVRSNSNIELRLNEAAVDILERYPGPLSIVSACGEYRTGKSFLLNSLFGGDSEFEVSATIEPCTQGINIMQSPITI